MNLREFILEEHSKSHTTAIVNWVGEDKKRFAELVSVFLAGEYRVTQRASWPLSLCVESHPALVVPHLGKLLRNLEKPGLHPAVVRNTMRLLQEIEVPEKYLGRLVDTCFSLVQKNDSPIAIRVFAMTVLVNIVKREPELKREVKELIESLMDEGSPGIKSRGRKMLAILEKIK